MRTIVTALIAIAGAALLQPVFADNHMDQGTGMSDQTMPTMSQMHAQMRAMQSQMQKIHTTTDPTERAQLMQEHMASMQAMMQMMGNMGMMGSSGHMGSSGMMGSGGMMGSSGENRMTDWQEHMQQRMDMMQQMMQQMLEHEAASEKGKGK